MMKKGTVMLLLLFALTACSTAPVKHTGMGKEYYKGGGGAHSIYLFEDSGTFFIQEHDPAIYVGEDYENPMGGKISMVKIEEYQGRYSIENDKITFTILHHGTAKRYDNEQFFGIKKEVEKDPNITKENPLAVECELIKFDEDVLRLELTTAAVEGTPETLLLCQDECSFDYKTDVTWSD